MKLKNFLPLLFPLNGENPFIGVAFNVGHNRVMVTVAGSAIYAIPSASDSLRGAVLRFKHGLNDTALAITTAVQELKHGTPTNQVYKDFVKRREEEIDDEISMLLQIMISRKCDELAGEPPTHAIPAGAKVDDIIVWTNGNPSSVGSVHASVERRGKQYHWWYRFGDKTGSHGTISHTGYRVPAGVYQAIEKGVEDLTRKYLFTGVGLIRK